MLNLTPWRAKRLPVHREEEQHPIYSLQREMNRVFDDFFRTPMFEPFGDFTIPTTEQFVGELTPRVDMSETDKEIVVKTELPGMTEKDVDVSIARDSLTISGEKKQEKEQNEKGWYRMERQYGSFTRTIPLPCEIESEKAEALFKNGVLTVKLPKSTAPQRGSKSITVKSA
jgi:HSP20 family protein